LTSRSPVNHGENCWRYQQGQPLFKRGLYIKFVRTEPPHRARILSLNVAQPRTSHALPIFPAVQKWISRRWILPPATVAPGDFEGSKGDLKKNFDEMTR